MQSTLDRQDNLHVAIIMDGNGRWATRRGLPRSAGHRAGAEAVRRVVEAAPELGVGDAHAVRVLLRQLAAPARRRSSALMSLLRHYLRAELARADRERRAAYGHRPPRPAAGRPGRRRSRDAEQRLGRAARGSHLRIAIDYSSRDAIANAAARWLGDRLADRATRSAGCSRRATAAAQRRRRSPHPHRRRKAAVRFPAVGVRLRRALLHRHAVARLRRRRSARRHRRFPSAASAASAALPAPVQLAAAE